MPEPVGKDLGERGRGQARAVRCSEALFSPLQVRCPCCSEQPTRFAPCHDMVADGRMRKTLVKTRIARDQFPT
jgi:hypothetical protein